MKKIILICMLSIIASIHCEKITSQAFWDEQVFMQMPRKPSLALHSLATIGCFTSSLLFAHRSDNENRIAHRRPFQRFQFNEALAGGFMLSGYLLLCKTFCNLFTKDSKNMFYIWNVALQLQSGWKAVCKDLTKLGIEQNSAKQLAHFIIFYKTTMGAKQIVARRLNECLLDKETSGYILNTFFGQGSENLYPLASFGDLKSQNIKNLMLLYDMYPYEAEYIVEKYYALPTKKELSPIAGKVMQSKLHKKFPNHPALELFSFE